MSAQDIPTLPSSPGAASSLAAKLANDLQRVPSPLSTTPERKRRSHQKSRKGCVTCKKRKVKCGEEKPVRRKALNKVDDF